MRLVCTITTREKEENPYEFSYYLKSLGIDNQCEEVQVTGETPYYRIWVIEEERFDEAKSLYLEYHKHPNDPKYLDNLRKSGDPTPDIEVNPQKKNTSKRAPYGTWSILILLSTILLFFWGLTEKGIKNPPKLPGVQAVPIFPPIYRALLFDFPHFFELRDKIGKSGSDERALLDEMGKTTYWNGLYDRFLNSIKGKGVLEYTGPMFEKIQKGEYYRLITPALLHFDFLHIFFNLLWFVLLSNQIEFRIGGVRYLFLFILTALISNVAQYLMSGFPFMGLSGVVVGMAGFIWARQQVAPWEGYLVHRGTLVFLGLFVVGMFLLQLILFFVEIYTQFTLQIAIANTAHLSGGIVGYLLGRLPLFSLRTRKF